MCRTARRLRGSRQRFAQQQDERDAQRAKGHLLTTAIPTPTYSPRTNLHRVKLNACSQYNYQSQRPELEYNTCPLLHDIITNSAELGTIRDALVQPFDSSPAFYATKRFINATIRVLHLSLSWARRIQSTQRNPIYKIHLNIIHRPPSCLLHAPPTLSSITW
jgi:hypothetical protein